MRGAPPAASHTQLFSLFAPFLFFKKFTSCTTTLTQCRLYVISQLPKLLMLDDTKV